MRVLLLGGTTDASHMAKALAAAVIDAMFSYAGRTAEPKPQPLPTRTGGFGGAAGLERFLRNEHISHVIDATHPFATAMSRNAVEACAAAGVSLIALERAAWQAGPGDTWRHVREIEDAVMALPQAPARIFLAIGRQNLAPFAVLRQHSWLLRVVDPPVGPLPIAGAQVVIARGPFTVDGDKALMQDYGVTHVVAKNAGGTGARAKLDAARMLQLPVILIDRPQAPRRHVAGCVEDVMAWLGHAGSSATERGV